MADLKATPREAIGLGLMTITPNDSPRDITTILSGWNRDSKLALDELMPLVSAELRRRASRLFASERRNHTLSPTGLVNEVYLRLVDRRKVGWEGRAHFFAFASRTMRRILVEHARQRAAEKRGGGARAITLTASLASAEPDLDLLDLDEALGRLFDLDPEQGRIVELRFFAGLSIKETAAVLEIGEATVVRRWASARAWLYGELTAS